MLILNKKYKVQDIDTQGKLYTNVSRAYMKTNDDYNLVLDYHCVLYKINKDDILNIQIYNDYEHQIKCEYQMNGSIYKIERGDNDKCKIYASFGGLLMIQDADINDLNEIDDRTKISLLVSRI